MSDDVDRANDFAERERQLALKNRKPFVLAEGKPGECDECGKWYGRIVDGWCVPCRNKHSLHNNKNY